MAWGEAVRRHAGTTRLSLNKDSLNSKLIYLTDAGSRYCYCYTYKHDLARGLSPLPMHVIIRNLTAYHRSLGLQIDMYHLDSGFWHSAEPNGTCDGVVASNWSASEFHWPRECASLQPILAS